MVPKSSLPNFYCFIIHEPVTLGKKKFWNKLYYVRKNAIPYVLCASVKDGTVLLWAGKILSEYLNIRVLLMSLKTHFSLWFFQVPKSSLTNFNYFDIHGLYLRETG